MPSHRLPLWLKLAFTLWIAIWAPSYFAKVGWQNFLWLCDLASLLILVALWTESRLLMSAQWLAVLVVGILWSLDVGGALLFGVHPIGGTEYMFNAQVALSFRLLSLFHVVLPVVTSYALIRLGYDRRSLWLQTALTWLVLPLTLLLTDPARNINWVHGLFGQPQALLDPLVYLLGLMIGWPIVLYLPSHLLAIALQRRQAG
ncbi:hypothetical protein [Halomonas icarae]|uniref:Membrane-associated protein n=1 Tax=Halomonas icarae TaxID=2691040 RepID=A0A7X4W0F3_9GAMM|nr:hypothetical protein [Halomonas icarae]MDR5900922.1 hypothetical protein [Halomonas icarae]NAW13611.1 hypothetical protein [Halomonas icarae]